MGGGEQTTWYQGCQNVDGGGPGFLQDVTTTQTIIPYCTKEGHRQHLCMGMEMPRMAKTGNLWTLAPGGCFLLALVVGESRELHSNKPLNWLGLSTMLEKAGWFKVEWWETPCYREWGASADSTCHLTMCAACQGFKSRKRLVLGPVAWPSDCYTHLLFYMDTTDTARGDQEA